MNLTIKGFIKKELIQALRDVRMRMIIFAVPAIQMTLFGLALTTEVRNIRLAIISQPEDTIAQKAAEKFYASGWFIPAKIDENDPFGQIKSQKAEVIIITPPGGLTKALNKGKGQIQVLIDATNSVRAQQIEKYVKAIIAGTVSDYSKDMPKKSALSFDIRVIYNPSMKSSVFMVPGVMCMVLGITTIILTSMSLAKEKETGTFETLIAAPVENWEILLGKTLPYVLLAMIDVPIILGVAVFLFDVPMRGGVWQIAVAALIFVCSTVSVGTLISTFAKTQQQAMMGGFIFTFPAVLLSGIMFPIENIPTIFKILAYINPLKYFVTLLRNIMLKGGNSEIFWSNTGILAVLSALAIFFAFKRFKQKLN